MSQDESIDQLLALVLELANGNLDAIAYTYSYDYAQRAAIMAQLKGREKSAG